MNMTKVILLFGLLLIECGAKYPQRPTPGSIPFMVYFASKYRGICVGVLVSRVAVLTAAVCVTSPNIESVADYDTRPINVIVGSAYRHIRRGIKVPVTKLILPKLPENFKNRGYLMQKSVAILLLQRKVPDVLTEVPLRAVDIDFLGLDKLKLQEECVMIGWHFLFPEDQVINGNFLLQRNMRFQLLNLVTKASHCDVIRLKWEKIFVDQGFEGNFVNSDIMCIRDPDKQSQPCHGMYGAPLICSSGRVVGMMLAPDAQWTNCTGKSNIIHSLNGKFMAKFFECVNKLFEPETRLDWDAIKNVQSEKLFDEEEYIIKDMYDGVITDFDSTSYEYK